METNCCSMTGYGSAQGSDDSLKLSAQVKSVNSRFLEIRIKSPSEYYSFEPELRKLISKIFSRGSVDVLIQRSSLGGRSSKTVTVDKALVKTWQKACQEIKTELNLSDRAYENLLVNGPHLAEIMDTDSTLEDTEKNLVLNTVQTAAEHCLVQRQAEGARLRTHLLDLLKELEGIVADVALMKEKLKPEITQRLKTRIEPRAKELGLEINADRLAQEALILVEKMDIDEELKRLDGHIKAVREHMRQKGPLGKKLEFFIQELFRETNTLGAKVQDLAVASKTVDAKTVIERMREQGQNIE